VQSLESKLRITVVDPETNHAMGVVSIPLKDIPFVHESMAFGLAKYYEFKPTSKDGITSVPGGMLRIGLKLLKQRHPTRKLVCSCDRTAAPRCTRCNVVVADLTGDVRA
jgi:hypothetical protein